MIIEENDIKKVVYKHVLGGKEISIASCEEYVVDKIQERSGDVYKLRYLGIDSEYDFYLALEKEKILGYAIIQKYFENYHMRENKGKRRGEPALVYSLERKKGVGSLLLLVSSLEIIKDTNVKIFRCETVKDNIFDRLCLKLSLNFSGEKDIFNFYELPLEGNNRVCLEKKIKELLKSL